VVPPTEAGDAALDELVRRKLREVLPAQVEALPRDLHAIALSWVERPLLEFVLEKTGGNQLRAAEILGINRNTLRKKITTLGVAIKK
jgi:two-component system nitrogen regulation response regulator GlnG